MSKAVGIDLGTTNSLVAVVRDANPVCLPDGDGRMLLPSAVRYRADGAPIVGDEALRDAAKFPHDTIVSVKRFMGRGPKDTETTLRFSPYEFAGSAPDDIENCTNRSPYPTLHLLREASIDRAVAAFPDAGAIYERNIETLRRLGHDGWHRLCVPNPG